MDDEFDAITHLKQRLAARDARDDWQAEWKAQRDEVVQFERSVRESPDVERLLKFGEWVRDNEYILVMKTLVFTGMQQVAALRSTLGDSSIGDKESCEYAIAELVHAACFGDEDSLAAQLKRLAESPVSLKNWIAWPFEWISDWVGMGVPATPHITRQTLVSATKDVKGFSNATFKRDIERTKLVVEEPIGPNKIGRWCQFRYMDREKHLTMLQCVVDFLEKKS